MYSKKPCNVEIKKKQNMLFLNFKTLLFCANTAHKKVKCNKQKH